MVTLAAQINARSPPTALVTQRVMVDPFVADGQMLFLGQPEADLLSAPVLAQQTLHQAPVIVGNARLGPGVAATQCQLMGLLGPVALPLQATVTPYLPADRGLLDADYGGDF